MTLVRAYAIAGLAGLLAGCAPHGAESDGSARRPPPPAYAAVAEGKADIDGGMIQVASRTAGIVREVEVREGDSVRAGQVLARQEDDAQRLAVQTAAAAVRQASAQAGSSAVQLAAAERERARLGRLDGVVSAQSADQASDALESARAGLEAGRAAEAVARAQLAEARYRLEQTVIRAPVDGVIARRYANPGSGASTLNVTAMFDIVPRTGRIVRAEVTESELDAVRVGQSVSLSPESDPTRAFPGRVLREAPVFGARKLQSDDPADRTDERVVEVVVSAEGAPFLIGQRVLVKFGRP